MLSDIGVVQTSDAEYAATLQRASDAAWKMSINQQFQERNDPLRDIGKKIEDQLGPPPKMTLQQPEDVIKINANEANILDFDITLETVKDRHGKEGVPIGGEFEIFYWYYIPQPKDGSDPAAYGAITPIIPASGGKPRGTFTDAAFLELKNVKVQLKSSQEGVIVQKAERYIVKKDPFVVWGGTYQINYRIAITNPNTGKVIDRSTTEQRVGFKGPRAPMAIPVLAVPKVRR
jgi:hypothetical protein